MKYKKYKIVQKFCEPGPSDIKEIDCVHSQIEKAIEQAEIYSTVGLVRILSRVPRNKPIRLMQLRPSDMFNYQAVANSYQYQNIPYTKVKALEYLSLEPSVVRYKTSFTSNWVEKSISDNITTRRSGGVIVRKRFVVRKPSLLKKGHPLSKEKIADLNSMLNFMPEQDKLYMQNICNSNSLA